MQITKYWDHLVRQVKTWLDLRKALRILELLKVIRHVATLQLIKKDIICIWARKTFRHLYKKEEIISTKTLLEENIHFLILLYFFVLFLTFFHIYIFNFTSVFFSPESLLHLSLIWPVASLILKIWLLIFLLKIWRFFFILFVFSFLFVFVCSLVDSQDLVIKMVSSFAVLFFVSFDL